MKMKRLDYYLSFWIFSLIIPIKWFTGRSWQKGVSNPYRRMLLLSLQDIVIFKYLCNKKRWVLDYTTLIIFKVFFPLISNTVDTEHIINTIFSQRAENELMTNTPKLSLALENNVELWNLCMESSKAALLRKNGFLQIILYKIQQILEN